MTILLTCLFIAVLLPYLAKLPIIFAIKKYGDYDNAQPREQQARLTGFGARAVGAHQNSFESLIVFSTAVLTVLVTNHITLMAQTLGVLHIILRLTYHGLYLLDVASLRTIVWALGYLCCLILLGMCL